MTAFRLAAPSCVLPLRVGPACQRLAGVVPEVALMFLETAACLAYGPEDLPPSLGTLPLTYHLHLPVDVPWTDGVAAACRVVAALRHKVAPLAPHTLVLHPPAPEALDRLLHEDPSLAPLLALENVAGADLRPVWPAMEAHDLAVCLDVGHLVAYGQEAMLQLPGFFERVRVLHVYGGEEGGRHQPLARLPDAGLVRRILTEVARTSRFRPVTLVLEVFAWEEFVSSRALLEDWMRQWGLPWWS